MSNYITLNEASRRVNKDPRQLAALLLNAGEQPDATLETEKGKQALFHADRVQLVAAELVASGKRNAKRN